MVVHVDGATNETERHAGPTRGRPAGHSVQEFLPQSFVLGIWSATIPTGTGVTSLLASGSAGGCTGNGAESSWRGGTVLGSDPEHFRRFRVPCCRRQRAGDSEDISVLGSKHHYRSASSPLFADIPVSTRRVRAR